MLFKLSCPGVQYGQVSPPSNARKSTRPTQVNKQRESPDDDHAAHEQDGHSEADGVPWLEVKGVCSRGRDEVWGAARWRGRLARPGVQRQAFGRVCSGEHLIWMWSLME
jgi:hypothetical protein